MQFLHTLDGLLSHIKAVEHETIELTKEAHLRMARFIQNNGLTPDDAVMEAMQYQDIIAQQLGATIEAIENVQGHLQHFARTLSEDDTTVTESIERMHEKLNSALEKAQQKYSAFGGKFHTDEDDGVEFF